MNIKGSQLGKTTELIKHCAETGGKILVMSEEEKAFLNKQAAKMGLEVEFYTVGEKRTSQNIAT